MRHAANALEAGAAPAAKMKDIATLLEALGTLLLPLAALVLVWRLWPYLAGVLGSRDFTVKMGGAELSVQNATTQFEQQLKDSTEKIVRLERQMTKLLGPGAAESVQLAQNAAPDTANKRVRPPAVLWVDDYPENNTFLIATLRDRGVRVETVRSTDEAMQVIGRAPDGFDVVISDLGRKEDGKNKPMAGRELALRLRADGHGIPMIVFATARALAREDELRASGVNAVTTSGTDLLRFVQENSSTAI